MNALAGGGTFATLPALIALGLPANTANATSNLALLPGAATSAWAFRDELQPIGGVRIRLLAAITFVGGLAGSALLWATPTHVFDLLIPWLLLFAFIVITFGKRAADALHSRVTITPHMLVVVQAALGIYGGYFGGGVGLIAWAACLPMLVGAVFGGWIGAHIGKRLPHGVVRGWTLFVTGATTVVFFWRAYF